MKIKKISGIIMMKIELKSRNFEKLQRFSAFSISTTSEKIQAKLINFIKITENRDEF